MSVYKIKRSLIQNISNNEDKLNHYKSLLFFTRKKDSELNNFSNLLEKVNIEIIGLRKSKLHTLNYKIKEVPSTYLIGPDGKVLARNLDLQMLDSFLKKNAK